VVSDESDADASVNEMDEEAHMEYDNAPQGRSREGSFNSQDGGSFEETSV